MRATLIFCVILACIAVCFAESADSALESASASSVLSQWRSIVSLAQVLDQRHYSGFPGDPEVNITIFNTIAEDGYKLERINSLGTHTGTHMSAPCHFLEGRQYPCIDQLPASAFVFVAALIDVSARVASNPRRADFQVTWNDILAYEATHQKIPKDAIVMLYTGFGPKYGTADYVNGKFPGFTADAVNKLFKLRKIKGTGSDTFGPDASSDENFEGSTATYENGGVTIENMNNLVALKGRKFGDLVVATPTKLKNGSGFQTNVLAFLK